MNNPKYRLKSILKVRTKTRDDTARDLKLCEEILAEKKTVLERLTNSRLDLNKKILNFNKKMELEMNNGTKAGNIISHQNHLMDLKNKLQELEGIIRNQKDEVKIAEDLVLKATEKLVEASKELKIIEKHKDNWMENERHSNKKKEQKFNDELAAILHQKSEKL